MSVCLCSAWDLSYDIYLLFREAHNNLAHLATVLHIGPYVLEDHHLW